MKNFDQLDLKALDANELQEIDGGLFFVFAAGVAVGVAAGMAISKLF